MALRVISLPRSKHVASGVKRTSTSVVYDAAGGTSSTGIGLDVLLNESSPPGAAAPVGLCGDSVEFRGTAGNSIHHGAC